MFTNSWLDMVIYIFHQMHDLRLPLISHWNFHNSTKTNKPHARIIKPLL